MDVKELKKLALFEGMTDKEAEEAVKALGITKKSVKKGKLVIKQGAAPKEIFIILNGSAIVVSTDAWGNDHVLSLLSEGDIAGSSYALFTDEVAPASVEATTNVDVISINADVLMKPSKASWQTKLLIAMLGAVATDSNKLLTTNILTSSKSARERIMIYLTISSEQAGDSEFLIPFDRQEMADYLDLERTALSKELGRMKDEGLIDYRKNYFKIIK